MNVRQLIAELEKIEDKDLEIRVIEEKDNGDPNFWLDRVEVSNEGDSGYEIGGEVRLIGEE